MDYKALSSIKEGKGNKTTSKAPKNIVDSTSKNVLGKVFSDVATDKTVDIKRIEDKANKLNSLPRSERRKMIASIPLSERRKVLGTLQKLKDSKNNSKVSITKEKEGYLYTENGTSIRLFDSAYIDAKIKEYKIIDADKTRVKLDLLIS